MDRGEAKESGVKEKGGGGVGRVKREGRESKTWTEVKQRRARSEGEGGGGVGRVKREGRESKTWTEVKQRRVE